MIHSSDRRFNHGPSRRESKKNRMETSHSVTISCSSTILTAGAAPLTERVGGASPKRIHKSILRPTERDRLPQHHACALQSRTGQKHEWPCDCCRIHRTRPVCSHGERRRRCVTHRRCRTIRTQKRGLTGTPRIVDELESSRPSCECAARRFHRIPMVRWLVDIPHLKTLKTTGTGGTRGSLR
jgi:hypothetical protein